MDPRKKLELRKLLKRLEGFRARHTELITVYIPSGYSITSVAQQLMQEQGTAENIKSKSTRKNVQAALERMVRQLRTYKATPHNGLALFSGNVSESEGGQDFQIFAIEPSDPINIKIYKCDQAFYLEPLKDILMPKKTYGLLVIDRQEGNIALLKGTNIIPLVNKESLVPGKTRKGGQSAHRFERVREGMAKDFFKKIGAEATNAFRDVADLHGIIVGGPGPTKENFVSGFLPHDIKEKVIAIKDVGYTGAQGLQELVFRSQDVLAKEDIIEEQIAVNHFLETLNKKPKFATYGELEVKRAITMGAVKLLLMSETIDEELAEKLSEQVEKSSGTWRLISRDSREGEQLSALGGIAAVLRFPVE